MNRRREEESFRKRNVGDVGIRLTISRRWQPQMPHSIADQLRQLLPLRASVQAEALLSDALGVVLAGVPAASLPPHALLTQTPRPLHALLPQQGVI